MRSLTGIALLLTLGIMSDAKTTQPNAMESTEEEPVHLPCNHSTISGNEYIYWYQQIPSQGPEYMIRGLKDNVTDGKATLIIAVARVQYLDSAAGHPGRCWCILLHPERGTLAQVGPPPYTICLMGEGKQQTSSPEATAQE
uniref:Immunoglobulin V-set domain-containing protein n=1 Tax=Ailuropoda melanoleuca TaxID=9646 RepID=A0A7N5KKX1_AILME